jgi:hypothetical protein
MADETLDETTDIPTDEPNTEEQTNAEEQVDATIELPIDADGNPIHVGDYVLVRGRADICCVVSMTTDGGDDDTVGENGLNGWVLHVKSAYPQQGEGMKNYHAHYVKVLELTPEQELLVDFFAEATRVGLLSYKTCKEYAEQFSVNE